MKLTRTIGLCLLVAFAVSAFAVASASAEELPTLYECALTKKVGKPAKYTGKYTDKKCSKEATTKEIEEGKTNKYELQPWSLESKKGKVKVFKGSGKGANLEVIGSTGIACTSSKDEGKFSSPTTAKEIKVTFKGCATQGLKCSNTATVGEIKTNVLEGEVGYVSGKGSKSPVIGTLIRPESGTVDAEFTCKNLFVRVEGTVIGEVSPADVNVFSKSVILIFKQSAGHQAITKFEGGPLQELLTGECFEKPCEKANSHSAEETEVKNTGEELELKA
jgi:hypothetical protein